MIRQKSFRNKRENRIKNATKQAFCGLRNSQYFCCTCLSLSGEKLAKEGSWEAVYGIWLSTFILTPIAVYLTYKATNDSALLDTDWYAGRLKALNERMRPAINKLKNAIKLKRNGKKHDSE